MFGFFNRQALWLIASRKDLVFKIWHTNMPTCQQLSPKDDCQLQPPNVNNPGVLTSEDYVSLTGLNKEQFQDLSSLLPSLHKSKVRSIIACIAFKQGDLGFTRIRRGTDSKIYYKCSIGIQEWLSALFERISAMSSAEVTRPRLP